MVVGAVRPVTDLTLQDPIRASQHNFRVALDALSNPGAIRQLIPHPRLQSERYSGNQYIAALMLSLLDHEVSLHVDGDDALAELLVRRTRAAIASAANADFVVAARIDPNLPEQLKRGGLHYPDDGATLIAEVEAIGSGDLQVTLAGPGIDGFSTLSVLGLNQAFVESRNIAVSNYPMGIDCYLVDSVGKVVGLPRTTRIQEGAR